MEVEIHTIDEHESNYVRQLMQSVGLLEYREDRRDIPYTAAHERKCNAYLSVYTIVILSE